MENLVLKKAVKIIFYTKNSPKISFLIDIKVSLNRIVGRILIKILVTASN